MIDEADIEKALDYLRDNADAAAQAIANRIYMEEYRKTVKADIMREHLDKPVNAQEREAYSDERYKDHLKAMETAIHLAEKWRFLCAAAEAKIKAWQTFSANSRPRI